MNKLLRKATAVLTAGIMTAAGLCNGSVAAGALTVDKTVDVAYEAGTTVAKPTYTIKGSAGVRKIRLSTATAGATIYYTIDGSVPDASSRVYKTGTLLKIKSNIRIRAIAIKGTAKSDVMNKTFKVATLVGDVTGDGNINQTDYTRFVSCANGKTSYVCIDNLDCNGDGRTTRKDITVLKQYLDREIPYLPYGGNVITEDPEEKEDNDDAGSNSGSSSDSSTLGRPGITLYRSYGGKSVEFSHSQSGVTFYYTIDGSTPTTSSTKYTSRFLVTKNATVKVIAYKNGVKSAVQQIQVSMTQTAKVASATDTSQSYSGSANVKLVCNQSDTKIIYTTDGSDPSTSKTATLYTGPFTITKTSTVKAIAQAKGYIDSEVSSFKFIITEDYTISGIVWNDTNLNGRRDSGESCVGGLTVYAYNTQNKSYAKQTTTNTNGAYTFNGLTRGIKYEIIVEFNYIQYRPTNTKLYKTTPQEMVVKNGGTYTPGGNLISVINNYKEAIKSSVFTVRAYTGDTYSDTVTDANLALVSMSESYLQVSVKATGQNSKNNVINGDNLSFTVTLTNCSLTQTLSDVTMGLYFTDSLSSFTFQGSGASNQFEAIRNGYRYYTISNLIGSNGLQPGRSVQFVINGTVSAATNAKIQCYSEVLSYRFAEPCLDCYSVPGNLSVGAALNSGEKDEARSDIITVTDDSGGTSEASISYEGGLTYTLYQGEECEFDILVKNISSTKDYIISFDGITLVTYSVSVKQFDSDFLITFHVKANTASNAGKAYFTVYLSNNTKKYVRICVDVSAIDRPY